MYDTLRTLNAEWTKLRGSSHFRAIWILPLLFIAMDFFVFQYMLLGINAVSEELMQLVDVIQIQSSGALWGRYFYPMFLAIVPALIFRVEHRNKMWNHLGVMPVSQTRIYLIKAFTVVVLSLMSLVFVWFLLWVEQSFMAFAAPIVRYKFHGETIALLLGWLWLGGLPLMSIYLWISNRINSIAVPVVFGIVGVLLSIMLTSQTVDEPWKRDFIPWLTPIMCVEQVLVSVDADKNADQVGKLFQEEPDIIRLPDGRTMKTWQNIPDHILFPPPPPTPKTALASYSLVVGLLFLFMGAWDAGRCRK